MPYAIFVAVPPSTAFNGLPMQRLSDIREILAQAGQEPRKRWGQNFLIDGNLLGKLVELAALTGREVVLEVGPGTGTLTEELLPRAGRVVCVEVDRGLADLLRGRLAAQANFRLVEADVLDGKHALSARALSAVAEARRELAASAPAHLVSNLPYNAAVPVVLNALLLSWAAARPAEAGGAGAAPEAPEPVLFERLTFTVQKELAQRLLARAGSDAYGPASVLVALLARATPGRTLPPEAFWPRPRVTSQMLRLDFDAPAAAKLADAPTLQAVLSATFGQRRKMLSTSARRRDLPWPAERFLQALAAAGIEPSLRPEQVEPQAFLRLANALVERSSQP